MRLATTSIIRPQVWNSTLDPLEEGDRRGYICARKIDISLSHASAGPANYKVEASIVYTGILCTLYTDTYTPALRRLSTNIKALLRHALACQQRSPAEQPFMVAQGNGVANLSHT